MKGHTPKRSPSNVRNARDALRDAICCYDINKSYISRVQLRPDRVMDAGKAQVGCHPPLLAGLERTLWQAA